MDRKKRYSETDWRVTHQVYMQQWETREKIPLHHGEPHDQFTFDEYLRWLHRSTRVHIKLPYTDMGIEEDSDEEVVEDYYDAVTRHDTQPQRAPLDSYIVRNEIHHSSYLIPL